MKGWGVFIVVVIILFILCGGGFYAYTRIRARRVSPNYPAPAPGGIVGWANDQWAKLKRGRFSQGTGYETARRGGADDRTRDADGDETWDANVGHDAYYEEQELGLHQPTAYSGAGYGYGAGAQSGGPAASEEQTRDGPGKNPFGDEHAASLRSVSPRPLDTAAAQSHGSHGHGGSAESSPTAERRSVFREEM